MSKINKTYLEIQHFVLVADNYLRVNGYLENNIYTEKEPTSKLVPAIKSVKKQYAKLLPDLNEEMEFLRIKHCAVDALGVQIKKDGIKQYTPDGEIKLKKELKSLLTTQTEIHQRIVEDFGKLNDQELEIFSEIVIPKQDGTGE